MYGFKGVYRGFRQLVGISGRSLALGDVGASRTRTEFWASGRGYGVQGFGASVFEGSSNLGLREMLSILDTQSLQVYP